MNIQQDIQNLIKTALKQLDLSSDSTDLEKPSDEKFGDWSSNIAMKFYRKQVERLPGTHVPKESDKGGEIIGVPKFWNNPRELAEAIVAKIRNTKPEFLQDVQVAGPGFINFRLSDQYYLQQLTILTSSDSEKPKSTSPKQKILVEFAHPNTLKQFHIGHLRNISIGESLVRLLRAVGHEVVPVNYQGDVGMHVAKALWGVKTKLKELSSTPESFSKKDLEERVKFLGEAYAFGSKNYEDNEQAKNEIIKINKHIYKQTDEDINKLWKITRQWSLEYFDQIYKRLNTGFRRFYFESEVHEAGQKAAQQALEKGILEKSQGAVVFNGEKYNLDTRVFLTKEGVPTYEAKELGLAPLEFSEFGEIDRCIHVVAPEQTSFFEVTFKVEELIDPGKYGGKQFHYKYGFVNLKQGKMSSRLGNVLTGMSVIDSAKKKITKILKETDLSSENQELVAEEVAVGAVKYSMLRTEATKNMLFDIEESVSLIGNSGPYIQYTFARAQSVLRRAKAKPSISKGINLNDQERALLRQLGSYSQAIERAAQQLAPHLICTYIYELAQRFNTFYNKHTILGINEQETMSNEQQNFRLALTQATANTLKTGLNLLGIAAPEKM